MVPRVLLVDDELHILRAAEFKLKRQGYEVMCASDGEEAWERMCEVRPDVVVTDCQMPRLNGIELLERMRSHADFADVPVLMVTAKGYELSRENLGVFDIVPKPFSPRELCRRVQEALNQATRQGSCTSTPPE
jgi:DNA-binding response OmpR family regulator